MVGYVCVCVCVCACVCVSPEPELIRRLQFLCVSRSEQIDDRQLDCRVYLTGLMVDLREF